MSEEQRGGTPAENPPPEVSVLDVPSRHRYEISLDGVRAGLTRYLDRGNQRVFVHTEIDDDFAGRGLGSELISGALRRTRAAGMRIAAVCPFVARYLDNHHEFDDIRDPVTPDVLAAVRAE
ncbi:GNAT family N-acetyltransferase [Actinopolyspora alba]|nr:GNAT family N-acetyltransferase [Actinopolyspora alba]